MRNPSPLTRRDALRTLAAGTLAARPLSARPHRFAIAHSIIWHRGRRHGKID